MLAVSNSIETAFSRSAESYHGLATVQKSCADKILAMISRSEDPLSILELGCGTGFLTKGLLDVCPRANITAVDISPNMLAVAEEYCEHTEQVQWVECDARDYVFPTNVDFILASSSLQWMEPLEELFPKINASLAPKGKFLFLLMLKETFCELHELRRELFPDKLPFSSFREENEIENLLLKSQFKIITEEISSLERQSPSGWELLKTLSRSGLTRGPVSRGKSLLGRTELIQLAEEYSERYAMAQGGVRATYQIGLFEVEKS